MLAGSLLTKKSAPRQRAVGEVGVPQREERHRDNETELAGLARLVAGERRQQVKRDQGDQQQAVPAWPADRFARSHQRITSR
jgi:hypothetical protein